MECIPTQQICTNGGVMPIKIVLEIYAVHIVIEEKHAVVGVHSWRVERVVERIQLKTFRAEKEVIGQYQCRVYRNRWNQGNFTYHYIGRLMNKSINQSEEI